MKTQHTPYFTDTLTRYISSSLILNDDFRHKILQLVENKEKALAPELGLDMENIVQATYLIEARVKRYQAIFVSSVLLFLALIMALGSSWLILFGFLLATSTIFYIRNKERNKLLRITDRLGSDIFSDIAEHLTIKSIKEIRPLPNDQQNLVVYSGYQPFVGAGQAVGTWSFPINIKRPKEDVGTKLKIIPFEIPELYDTLTQNLERANFLGFRSDDYLFVNGIDVREFDWILPDVTSFPVLSVDQKYIKMYQTNHNSKIRYYKWFRCVDWTGELILSYLIRIIEQGDHLYIESNRFISGALSEKYQSIDTHYEPEGFEEVSNSLLLCFIAGPISAIVSVLRVLFRFVKWLWQQERFAHRHREISQNTKFDYGTHVSLRTEISADKFKRFSQKMDLSKNIGLFEKAILTTLLQFLEEHNIDTSDLEERQQTILNLGLIVQGGAVTAQSLAVGDQAQASMQQQ